MTSPQLGDEYICHEGITRTVVKIFFNGVVFDDESLATIRELNDKYTRATTTKRPEIGDEYITRDDVTVFVAAVWESGVVFDNETTATLTELADEYTSAENLNVPEPRCGACGGRHEPEYEHKDTPKFRQHIQDTHGREFVENDLYNHCHGLMRQMMIAAREVRS